MSYFTYILYFETLNKYYIGSTEDLNERLDRHLSKHKGFTSRAKDWDLKYKEEFDLRSKALDREKQIKRWKSRKMIEKLLSIS
jgi:putative endonuclease